MEEDIVFILGDKLPTYYDAAIAIFSVCRKVNSAKMDAVIRKYADAVILMWEKSFSLKYVMSRNGVIKHIEKLVQHYYNNVVSKMNRTKPKHHGEILKPVSERSLNKEWKQSSLPIRLKGDFAIDGLMDLGVEMDSLEGKEKVFYHDQKNTRICRLSVEIDDEWVEEQLVLIENERKIKEQEEEENCVDDEDELEDVEVTDPSLLDSSLMSVNRSGLVRIPTEDITTQTEARYMATKPDVRIIHDCLVAVKTVIVVLCVNCNLSAKMAIYTGFPNCM